jgi:hypothetical protein
MTRARRRGRRPSDRAPRLRRGAAEPLGELPRRLPLADGRLRPAGLLERDRAELAFADRREHGADPPVTGGAHLPRDLASLWPGQDLAEFRDARRDGVAAASCSSSPCFRSSIRRLRSWSRARFFAVAISHAPGLSGIPASGHCSSALTSASCARSSASPTSRTMRTRPPSSRADSIRQTASMALRVVASVVTRCCAAARSRCAGAPRWRAARA